MRILVFSNFYPPHFIGGYEIGCNRIAQELSKRGHECHVLTSVYGTSGSDRDVSRVLPLWMNGRTPQRFGHIRALMSNWRTRQIVAKKIKEDRPDVVYVWNPCYLYPAALEEILTSSVPVSCFISDVWPNAWRTEEDGAFHRVANAHLAMNRSLARSFLRLDGRRDNSDFSEGIRVSSVQFASNYLSETCGHRVNCQNSRSVVPWGICRNEYLCNRHWSTPARRFLYAGQLSPHKGIQTALEAFCEAAARSPNLPISLSVAGKSGSMQFLESLESTVDRYQMNSRVQFLGQVPPEKLVSLYKSHDAFIFPSAWDEPFSIALVEALSAGLPVICTMTGGTPEIIRENKNGLTFPVADVFQCSQQIRRLATELHTCQSLSLGASQSTQYLTIENMADQIERQLLSTMNYAYSNTPGITDSLPASS